MRSDTDLLRLRLSHSLQGQEALLDILDEDFLEAEAAAERMLATGRPFLVSCTGRADGLAVGQCSRSCHSAWYLLGVRCGACLQFKRCI